jgi:hypothetical protein
MKGNWNGNWNADRSKFLGVYTFPDGHKFAGEAAWATERVRTHIEGTGRVMETVHIPMTPHWEYTGSWIRADGLAASAPHIPEAPEERDDGTPKEDFEPNPEAAEAAAQAVLAQLLGRK